jgi:alkylation response protein AidB-like acyl-CoA dehydrogenase
MNLQLSDTLKHLKASTFDQLDTSVDWEGFVVHPSLEKGRTINGGLSDPLTQNLWAPAPEPRDERLLSAIVQCESVGRSFAPISLRTTLMTQWLGTAIQRRSGQSWDLADCLLSIRGDGMAGCERLKASPDHSGRWHLHGERLLIEGSRDARAVVADGRTDRGLGLFLVDLKQNGVARVERDVFDMNRPAAGLSLGQASPVSCDLVACGALAHDLVNDLVDLGRVLATAEMIGIADMVLAIATSYACGRRQFGRPIAHFQSVSHACADMLCDIELARSLLYAVAARHRGDGVPATDDAAMAKALAADLCPRVADRALHIFGAEGATWDRGIHFIVRRLQTLRLLWGDDDACEQELEQNLG